MTKSESIALAQEWQHIAERCTREIVRMRKMIAEAPVVTLALANGDDLTILSAENAEDWAGIDVRMLKLGDGDRA